MSQQHNSPLPLTESAGPRGAGSALEPCAMTPRRPKMQREKRAPHEVPLQLSGEEARQVPENPRPRNICVSVARPRCPYCREWMKTKLSPGASFLNILAKSDFFRSRFATSNPRLHYNQGLHKSNRFNKQHQISIDSGFNPPISR